MKDVTRAKGLGDLRTVTTHHIPSKQPRKGTTYLDLFALSMERQRLEQELAGIERRRQRILDRLSEAQKDMDELLSTAQQEREAQSSSVNPSPGHCQRKAGKQAGQQWKKIAVGY